MKQLWFKAKRYGVGWYPSSWQGWLVTLIHTILFIAIWIETDSYSQTIKETLSMRMTLTFTLLVSLITICYLKGEKPRWRWGN